MLAGLLLTATIASADAPTVSPTPPYAALISPTESARYALRHGCVAAARGGVRMAQVPNHFLRLDLKRNVYLMTGAGRVEVSEPDGAGCYLKVGFGRAQALRAMALEILSQDGPVQTVSDSGPGSSDSGGPFRQELLCLTLGGRPVTALMSTSEDRKRSPLQLTLVTGPGKPCSPDAPTALCPPCEPMSPSASPSPLSRSTDSR